VTNVIRTSNYVAHFHVVVHPLARAFFGMRASEAWVRARRFSRWRAASCAFRLTDVPVTFAAQAQAFRTQSFSRDGEGHVGMFSFIEAQIARYTAGLHPLDK
jgi:hypothetical protein